MNPNHILNSSVILLWILSIALGLFFLWKLLSHFFEKPVLWLTILLILFGTNYFWLIVFAGPTTNAFLFTLFLAIILLTVSWQKKFSWLPLVAMLPGMVIISFLFAPGMAGFPILPANIHRVLFSAENGWLTHTPLVIFALAGFYFLAEKNRTLFTAAFLVILIDLITVAGNPTWQFENCFGYPNLVETYAVLCLPLGYFIQWAWTRSMMSRILVLVLSGLLILMNLFQTWQFQKLILHAEIMTEKYCYASDTIPNEAWVAYSRIANFDFENPMPECESFRLERAAHNGTHGLLLNAQRQYSPGLTIPITKLTQRDSTWIKPSGYFFFTCKNSFNKVFLVITCTHLGTPYKYKVSDLSAEKYLPNHWNKVEMSYLVPFPVDPGDLIQVYFMNYGGEECFIDDVEINLCKPRQR